MNAWRWSAERVAFVVFVLGAAGCRSPRASGVQARASAPDVRAPTEVPVPAPDAPRREEPPPPVSTREPRTRVTPAVAVDGVLELPGDIGRGLDEPPPDAERDALFAKLFPVYQKDLAGRSCDKSSTMAEARDLGEFAPEITGRAEGSFTAKNAAEILYWINLNECNSSHAEDFGSSLFVITSKAGDVVLRVPDDGRQDVAKIVDLDGDGREELLLDGSFFGMGISTSSLRLVEFRPGSSSQKTVKGSLRVIRDFGVTYENDCSGSGPTGVRETRVFARVRAGKEPQFFTKDSHTVCPPP